MNRESKFCHNFHKGAIYFNFVQEIKIWNTDLYVYVFFNDRKKKTCKMFMFNINFINEWGRKKYDMALAVHFIKSRNIRNKQWHWQGYTIDLHGKIWNINTLLKFYDTLIFRESNMQDCHYVDEAPQTCVLNAYSPFV